MSPIEIARRFAIALDEDDYAAAGSVIHPNCIYIIGDTTITGRKAILDSYRNASASGRAMFDSLEYDSNVSMTDHHTALIDFLDILTHNGQRHEHRCQQVLTIDDGLVSRIEHRDLPGETESLAAFRRAAGLDT